jgi:uncharacterized protein (TIGR02145 family)
MEKQINLLKSKAMEKFKQFTTVLFLLLILSCSTNNDSNGNSSNTTVVPIAPSNLIGTAISTTEINLSWTDNSTNETGFKIERRTGIGNYTVVGTVNADVLTFSDTGLTSSTSYTYRVYSYNTAGKSPTYSNEVTTAALALPTLTTTSLSSITTASAISGGTILSDGGATITARGVVWSTSPNPTIELFTKTNDGTGTGTFVSTISTLLPNTTYYARAYAVNSEGAAYGNEINFSILQNVPGPTITDIDGNVYETVSICNQTWTKKNLNVSKYTDGTPIPQITDLTQWANNYTGAWCYYANTTSNGNIYGKLYNEAAIQGIYNAASLTNPALRKKLAPTGYHIPKDAEWQSLNNCLGGSLIAGGKMKETGNAHWVNNTGATNESGFTGLPGGARWKNNQGDVLKGLIGFWWSASIDYQSNVTNYQLSNNDTSFNKPNIHDYQYYGFSVRCVKD